MLKPSTVSSRQKGQTWFTCPQGLFNYLAFQSFMSVHDQGYSRNPWCTLTCTCTTDKVEKVHNKNNTYKILI